MSLHLYELRPMPQGYLVEEYDNMRLKERLLQHLVHHHVDLHTIQFVLDG